MVLWKSKVYTLHGGLAAISFKEYTLKCLLFYTQSDWRIDKRLMSLFYRWLKSYACRSRKWDIVVHAYANETLCHSTAACCMESCLNVHQCSVHISCKTVFIKVEHKFIWIQSHHILYVQKKCLSILRLRKLNRGLNYHTTNHKPIKSDNSSNEYTESTETNFLWRTS